MMKAIADTTRPYGIKTIVSLNPIMIDGTGMCGGCRVTVGGEISRIGEHAFFNWLSLESITLSEDNGYFCLNDGVLYNSDMTALIKYTAASTRESFSVPDTVTVIDHSAFMEADNLKSIIFPEGLTTIGKYAFYCCYSMESIEIPESVTSIGEGAFYTCSLSSVRLGNRLKDMGVAVFGGCDSLTNIEVASDNPYYKSVDGNVYSKDGTVLVQYAVGKTATEFIIPNDVKKIGGAFAGSNFLTKVVIPNGVTEIGDMAFQYCENLEAISIPDSVTKIGNNVFEYCNELNLLVVGSGLKSVGSSSFSFGCFGGFSRLYYRGTADTWKGISVDEDNDDFLYAKRYYYSETEPTVEGNYWYYDLNGEVQTW